jgi:hypothetical protein
MEMLCDEYVNIADGIEVPKVFKKGNLSYKLMNHGSKLILRDD